MAGLARHDGCQSHSAVDRDDAGYEFEQGFDASLVEVFDALPDPELHCPSQDQPVPVGQAVVERVPLDYQKRISRRLPCEALEEHAEGAFHGHATSVLANLEVIAQLKGKQEAWTAPGHRKSRFGLSLEPSPVGPGDCLASPAEILAQGWIETGMDEMGVDEPTQQHAGQMVCDVEGGVACKACSTWSIGAVGRCILVAAICSEAFGDT